MGVYLGVSGHVELNRSSLNTALQSVLNPDDVNVPQRRFSFDFDTGALITGDQIVISTTNGSPLELVAGHAFPDWRGFINVDDAGGIRLFPSFQGALNGDEDGAIALTQPTAPQPISAKTRGDSFRCLAQVSSYEITTARETVDITALGEEHRRNYASGLISGQGTLSCLWDYRSKLCDGAGGEFPHYLAQLVLRTEQGSSFQGRFYLNTDTPDQFLWYQAECIVTNVAMSFEPTQPVRSQIQFVTTGPVKLHMGMPPSHLLQEDGSLILQEDGEGLLLED